MRLFKGQENPSRHLQTDMRVPTHLLQPLSVDTSTSYDLDMSRFPGLDDPRYKNEPMLVVADRQTNYFGYNNIPWTCSGRRESEFSSSQTMPHADAGTSSRFMHSSVHPVQNMGVPEDLLEIIDLPNTDLLDLLDTKQYEILVDDLNQELNRHDPLPDIQILAVEPRRDTCDERRLYANYHRPDLHATPFEQRRLSCYQTEIPQQHLRNNLQYSKTSNMCKDFKGYMYPTYSLTSNRCVAVNGPVNSFGNTLVNPMGDKSVATAAVRNKRKWSSDSDNSHKRRCLQPRHVDYLGQYSVMRQGSQIGVM